MCPCPAQPGHPLFSLGFPGIDGSLQYPLCSAARQIPLSWQMLCSKPQQLLPIQEGAEGSQAALSIPKTLPTGPTSHCVPHPTRPMAPTWQPGQSGQRGCQPVPKEGETEARSSSSWRDSAREPPAPPTPETSPAKWENPTVLGWERVTSALLGNRPLSPWCQCARLGTAARPGPATGGSLPQPWAVPTCH